MDFITEAKPSLRSYRYDIMLAVDEQIILFNILVDFSETADIECEVHDGWVEEGLKGFGVVIVQNRGDSVGNVASQLFALDRELEFVAVIEEVGKAKGAADGQFRAVCEVDFGVVVDGRHWGWGSLSISRKRGCQ